MKQHKREKRLDTVMSIKISTPDLRRLQQEAREMGLRGGAYARMLFTTHPLRDRFRK